MLPLVIMTNLNPPNATALMGFLGVLQEAATEAKLSKRTPLHVEFLDRDWQSSLHDRLACFNLIDQLATNSSYANLRLGIGTIRNPAQLTEFAKFQSVKFMVFPMTPAAVPPDSLLDAIDKLPDEPEMTPKMIFGGADASQIRSASFLTDVVKLYPARNAKNVKEHVLALDPERPVTVIPTGGVTVATAKDFFDLSFGNVKVGAGLGSEFAADIANNDFAKHKPAVVELIYAAMATLKS